MHASIQIAGADFVVDYDYKITCPGRPARWPSWASPGEPPEPMEFEVTVTALREDLPGRSLPAPLLQMPEWLKDAIEEDLAGRDDVYEAIIADARSD